MSFDCSVVSKMEPLTLASQEHTYTRFQLRIDLSIVESKRGLRQFLKWENKKDRTEVACPTFRRWSVADLERDPRFPVSPSLTLPASFISNTLAHPEIFP